MPRCALQWPCSAASKVAPAGSKGHPIFDTPTPPTGANLSVFLEDVAFSGGYRYPLPSVYEGRTAVWRTRDAGSSWERLDRGLPQHDAHVGVLREGMAIDSLDTPGLYVGTSTGQVFASTDEGDSWSGIASYLPAISSVEVAVVD